MLHMVVGGKYLPEKNISKLKIFALVESFQDSLGLSGVPLVPSKKQGPVEP
jgi:hypothetical protein